MTNSPILYSASIEFDRKKVTRLTRIQFYSRALVRTIITVLCAAALLIIGIGGQRGFLSTLALAFGAFLIISIFSRESSLSGKIISHYNGEYPIVFYRFSDDGISGSQTKELIPYSDITMLLEDSSFIYLFRSSSAVIMIEKSSVKGERELNGLMDYLCEKTTHSFKKTSFLLTANIVQLFRDWRAKADSENFSGDRLG